LAVLQFPGPDGVRPGMLAERAGMSKQAMNQLLGASTRSGTSPGPTRPVKAARELSS
jgi:hypothetical protein